MTDHPLRSIFNPHPTLLTSATLVATLALGVGIATGAGLKTRTASTTVGSGPAIGSATASCPAGAKVVSGGFSGPDDPSGAAAEFNAYSSFRVGKKSWTAAAENFGAAPGAWQSFAYCQKGARISTKSSSALVPGTPPYTASATATCGHGQRVVSGGYSSSRTTGSGPEIDAFTSRMAGSKSWTVSAVNVGGTAGTLNVFAYCRDGEKLKARSVSATLPDFSVGSATAQCKKGENVISGGYAAPLSWIAGGNPHTYFSSSYKSGSRSWTVTAENYNAVGTITATANCEKK